eukprot:6185372-Pleurochrysis_carterae.AAC.1
MHAGHALKTKSCSPRRCCQAVPRCLPRNENHDLIWKSQLSHYKIKTHKGRNSELIDFVKHCMSLRAECATQTRAAVSPDDSALATLTSAFPEQLRLRPAPFGGCITGGCAILGSVGRKVLKWQAYREADRVLRAHSGYGARLQACSTVQVEDITGHAAVLFSWKEAKQCVVEYACGFSCSPYGARV